MRARRTLGTLFALAAVAAAVARLRERAFAKSEIEFARVYPRVEPST